MFYFEKLQYLNILFRYLNILFDTLLKFYLSLLFIKFLIYFNNSE